MEKITTQAASAMEKKVATFLTLAHTTKIESHESLREANDQLIGIKVLRKQIGSTFKPLVDSAKTTVRDIKDTWDGFDLPLVEAMRIHESGISSYYRLLERKRKDEQDRIDAEARERAKKALKVLEEKEEEKKKEAREALAAGDLTRFQAIAEKVEPLPEIETPKAADTLSEIPKLEGSTIVKRWKFRIIDETKIPIEYRKIDEVKIGKYVRAMQKDARIPGVEIYSDDSITNKGIG